MMSAPQVHGCRRSRETNGQRRVNTTYSAACCSKGGETMVVQSILLSSERMSPMAEGMDR